MNNELVFLNRLKDKIELGEYDKQLSLPFMSRRLLYANVKSKIEKRISTGGTPVLSDVEIAEIIDEMKEAAATTLHVFLTQGLMVKTETGYELTELANKLLNVKR